MKNNLEIIFKKCSITADSSLTWDEMSMYMEPLSFFSDTPIWVRHQCNMARYDYSIF